MNGHIKKEDGFSLAEMLVSMLILIPIVGAAVSLFSVAVNQNASEQSSIEANQDARSGLDLMTTEIAQAGSHKDWNTTTNSGITASVGAQTVAVASNTGFTVGDYVDVDNGATWEQVQITAVGSNTLTGIFRVNHASGVSVRLFALPYITGVIPPAGLGANSSTTVTQLKFYGDMSGNGDLNYVEYNYDATNAQITRSMTPITDGAKSAALPFVRGIKAGSVQFTLYTDSLGTVTSVSLALTVDNTWRIASRYQETALSSRVVIPSAIAASTLLAEIQQYGGPNHLPATPAHVATWSTQ
ncbi:MAG TPA: hypothetical protein VE398_17935 [Acidobacteriota bacterium]|nr:hypothetical protein [Acidobacteriota bacterium]